ncbi:hypothetical protein [Chryseobacterium sp. EZn1]|uniref:hypothetical protein n=1 Tax=Chryseobacterium cupriresistens TaxID=3366770 RepID=UPI003984A01F
MISKGRLIIISGNDKITTDEAKCKLTSYQLLAKAFGLLSLQRDVRIEVIMVSSLIARRKENYSTFLEKQDYHNAGCIHIQKKQNVDDFYERILEANVVCGVSPPLIRKLF